MTPPSPPPIRRNRLTRSTLPRAVRPLEGIEHAEAVLSLLDRQLFLTNDQIEHAVFSRGTTRTGQPRAAKGAAYAANTALRRLFDGGWVDRIPVFLPATKPDAVKSHYVNVLTTLGARHIARVLRAHEGTPRWRRSLLPRPWQPLLHAFWIREFAIQARTAIEAPDLRFWSWFDDRDLAALKKHRGARFATIPDGFFLVTDRTTDKHFPHFVEIDLGTQTAQARTRDRPDWRGKVEGYLHYFERDFQEQFGLSALPLVLTVTTSEPRLANLLAVTAQAGGGGRFWFTTLEHLFPSTVQQTTAFAPLQFPFLAPIWRTPVNNQVRNLADRWRPSRYPLNKEGRAV